MVTSGSLTTTTTYDYQGQALLGLSARRSDGATYTIDYMYDESGVVFAGVYAGSDATAGVRFEMSTTDRGDVRELMDASGNSFAFYSYDAWGNPIQTATAGTSQVGAAVAAAIAARQPLRYASYAYDTESGLYYLSQRYYDPSTMQFVSKDPARADGEMSAYLYCGNDPVNRVDPEGLWGWGSIWGAVKRVVHAVVHTVYHAAVHIVHAVVHAVSHFARAVVHAVKQAAHHVSQVVHHYYQRASSYVSHVFHRPSAAPKKIVKSHAAVHKRSVARLGHADPRTEAAAQQASIVAQCLAEYHGAQPTNPTEWCDPANLATNLVAGAAPASSRAG